MSRFAVLAALVAFTAVACPSFGQVVNFDDPMQSPPCTYAFPIGPCSTAGDPEGVSWNGGGGGNGIATVDTTNGHGFPTSGSQYARITASGPGSGCGMGGLSGIYNEIVIPIPPTATAVSFDYEFYNAEQFQDPFFNDGMSVTVLDAGGALLTTLVCVDTFTITGDGSDLSPCFSTALSGIALTVGPEALVNAALPVGSVCLRVACWNGGDDGFPSHTVIDNVVFGAFVPPFAAILGCNPGGNAIDFGVVNGNPGNTFFLGLAVASSGVAPNGWFYGIDISWVELNAQISLGPPFTGVIGAAGTTVVTLPAVGCGTYGITVDHVAIEFAAGSTAFVQASTPQSLTL